jgi:hypothetical protein
MLVKILQLNPAMELAGYVVGEVIDTEPMSALKWITGGFAEVVEEKAIGSAPENKMLGTRATKRQRL